MAFRLLTRIFDIMSTTESRNLNVNITDPAGVYVQQGDIIAQMILEYRKQYRDFKIIFERHEFELRYHFQIGVRNI